MPKINSKAKGNRNELALTKILNERFNTKEFSRVPSSGAWTGGKNRDKASGLSEEAKQTLSGDIMTPKNFLYSIESKAYASMEFWDLFNESSNLFSWMKQSEEDAEFVGKQPMLIVKINRHETLVFTKDMGFHDYFFECRGWYCRHLKKFLEDRDTEEFFEKI